MAQEHSRKTNNIRTTALQLGDEASFISLFYEYYALLCAYSRRYVGRKDIAEEIVSETFFSLWENRESLQNISSIKAYLYKAVTNNSLNFLRKLENERKLEAYFAGTENGNVGFKELANNLTEQSILFQELAARIEDAVSQLPPQQQKVFRMKRFEGKKSGEVAEETGLSVKTVEMHFTKAIFTLRTNLKDYLPFVLFCFLLHE